MINVFINPKVVIWLYYVKFFIILYKEENKEMMQYVYNCPILEEILSDLLQTVL